jgi:hypothetical protein
MLGYMPPMRGNAYALIGSAIATAVAASGSGLPPRPRELVCTADRAVNQSTGDPVPDELRVVRHGRANIKARPGGVLVANYSRRNEQGGMDAEYRIVRTTGRFDAEAIETRNDIGEEHVIRLAGICVDEAP